MYDVLQAKSKNSTPHSSLTDEPRNTKNGRYNFGPTLTPCAKICLGRSMRGGATKPQFHVNLRSFQLFFLHQTLHLPEIMVRFSCFDTSNDVFSCVFVCGHIEIIPNSNLGGDFPQNPHFSQNRDFSRPTH
jgi:hypothetical protein